MTYQDEIIALADSNDRQVQAIYAVLARNIQSTIYIRRLERNGRTTSS
jgi:hypothetical protein